MNQPFRFESREEAGRILAKKLFKYHDRDDLVILGLPRGGVPVAFVIARQLEKPLDIFLVSKITSPLQQELAPVARSRHTACAAGQPRHDGLLGRPL